MNDSINTHKSVFSIEENKNSNEHNFSKISYNDEDLSSKSIYTENIENFRRWTILYPIYFDARRSIKGGRKVPANMAVINPLAKTIADGAKTLGFSCIFEPNKTHPKDWANPGRIRIFFKENDIPVHSSLKTKKDLYQALSNYLQTNPTIKTTPMEVPIPGFNKPPSPPNVPKGVLMGDILPLNSPALVSDEFLENLLKDMFKEQKHDIKQPKRKKEKKKK
ncbi:hypothetical protein PCANB_002075 [Pneumocystis canis]|nr:hypothetical protein PCANB_002075 [Pneumocystis canis]